MSWVERIKEGIEIVTGDGKTYRPLYMIAEKTVEYNIAEFDFPEIVGTLVKRGTPRGARYNFELVFQGENHIDEMLAFERSNIDNRPWNVTHPIYGKLLLHPSSLKYDPTGLNTSKISGEMLETITDEAPKMSFDPKDKVGFDVNAVKSVSATSFAANASPSNSDVAALKSDVNSVYSLGAKSVKSGDQSNDYFALFNAAQSAVLNASSDAGFAATNVINLYTYPALFTESIKNKSQLLLGQFQKISSTLLNLTNPNLKSAYEMQAGAIVTAAVSATVNSQPGDYTDVNSVLSVIDSVLFMYNLYIENLDSLQTENAGDVDSYVPDFNSVSSLSDLVDYAVSNLMNIAIGAKQKRTLILEADSNVLLLAHRFYGISTSESTVDDFIAQNNIGLTELLQVQKGRVLTYYV